MWTHCNHTSRVPRSTVLFADGVDIEKTTAPENKHLSPKRLRDGAPVLNFYNQREYSPRLRNSVQNCKDILNGHEWTAKSACANKYTACWW